MDVIDLFARHQKSAPSSTCRRNQWTIKAKFPVETRVSNKTDSNIAIIFLRQDKSQTDELLQFIALIYELLGGRNLKLTFSFYPTVPMSFRVPSLGVQAEKKEAVLVSPFFFSREP